VTGRLVVITGTGTEIGKTHVTEAVLLASKNAGLRAVGLKPVESGVGEGDSDAARLQRASTFHVKPFGVALRAPVSPHRAAREEGVTLPLDRLAAEVHATLAHADLVFVELPGGLFTPLADATVNADFAARLGPRVLLLVAPDRLGVLHDVLATTRAAEGGSLRVHGIVLVTPETPDASTGTNAQDLGDYSSIPVLATIPRAAAPALATDPSVALILAAIRR
jgi:dethiobiotin synthetase